MAVPTYQDLMLPFLKELADGNSHQMRELVSRLAEVCKLTDEEKAQLLPSGQRTIAHRVGWTRTYLKKAGLVTQDQPGSVEITDAGRQVLNENPACLDRNYLKRFDSFREFIKSKPKSAETVESSESTPEETIEAAYGELSDRLAADLLEKLKGCSPYFFERVVLLLLQAMGYGGVGGRGVVTPKSNDAGIDGIIYEDKLGLDIVCLQAKRWEKPVGRPRVQEFVGSMDIHRSRKGVILTTSQFSADAIEYVDRIEGKKVVLIGGEELCKLMIEHRVGVTPKQTYVLLDVSQDFFDEEA